MDDHHYNCHNGLGDDKGQGSRHNPHHMMMSSNSSSKTKNYDDGHHHHHTIYTNSRKRARDASNASQALVCVFTKYWRVWALGTSFSLFASFLYTNL